MPINTRIELAPLKVEFGDGERRSARHDERKEPRRSWKRTRSILMSAMVVVSEGAEALSGRFGRVVEAVVFSLDRKLRWSFVR